MVFEYRPYVCNPVKIDQSKYPNGGTLTPVEVRTDTETPI